MAKAEINEIKLTIILSPAEYKWFMDFLEDPEKHKHDKMAWVLRDIMKCKL